MSGKVVGAPPYSPPLCMSTLDAPNTHTHIIFSLSLRTVFAPSTHGHPPTPHALVIAKTTSFQNSNLQGCRFYKAYLVAADFRNADLRGASLEDTSMDDAIFTNANAAGAYFSASILDAKDLSNVDFTDAQIPIKTLPQLCLRDDVTGKNPVTGVDTRESLLCP
jgi:uncharacterized protein YjbI with pentapeptide repeats